MRDLDMRDWRGPIYLVEMRALAVGCDDVPRLGRILGVSRDGDYVELDTSRGRMWAF